MGILKMETKLYIYDLDRLTSLRELCSDYQIISIAQVLNQFDALEKLEYSDVEDIRNTIIDISNVVADGMYYRTFIERYILKLIDNVENINFCIQACHLNSFVERFPLVFAEENINCDFCTIVDDENQATGGYTVISPMDLHIYKNTSTAKKYAKEGLLVSLSDLLEESNGLSMKYSVLQISLTIEKYPIEFIDISSVINMLKARNDLVVHIEIMLHSIMKVKEVKFCAKSNLIHDIFDLFPFIFDREVYFDERIDEGDDIDQKTVNIDEVNTFADKIYKKLKGHTDFKDDFKHNLLKFSFLNIMEERKILSVMLSGESGIGKTEFAKIVSHTLYPNESLIKINFGNYSTEGVLNSLIGSPLGYMGSEEGGELIKKVNASKSKIILIDEFERATPSVFNFFYELLEDGSFTDRHGDAHDLDGYIIIFTSNMTKLQYEKHVPNSLKSRFDMVYYFVDIPEKEKLAYIYDTANSLIKKMNKQFSVELGVENMKNELNKLSEYCNLRDIKRRLEDIVFDELFLIIEERENGQVNQY